MFGVMSPTQTSFDVPTAKKIMEFSRNLLISLILSTIRFPSRFWTVIWFLTFTKRITICHSPKNIFFRTNKIRDIRAFKWDPQFHHHPLLLLQELRNLVENENRQTLSRTQKISTNLPSSELVTSLLQKSNLLLSDQVSDRQIKFVEQTLSKVRTFWRKWQKEVYSRGRLRGYRDGRVAQQEKIVEFQLEWPFLEKNFVVVVRANVTNRRKFRILRRKCTWKA